MTDRVIEHTDNSSSMTLVVGIILLILTVVFFMFGGASLFSGRDYTPSSGGEGGSINVEIPEEINVNTNPGE